MLDGQVGDFVPFLSFEEATGIEDTLVFRLRCNNMFAPFAVKVRGALDTEVVGFRGATGENNFLGVAGVNQTGHLLPGHFHDPFGFPAKGMGA